MNTPHPRDDLSAYLDDALRPAERAAVQAHLDTCADCRARLAELRATARLIAALPDPAPARRLVPRLAAPPAWLAPLRTLTTLASGLSVFLFLATALLANIGSLAQGTATSAGGGVANAPAASAGARGPVAPPPSSAASDAQRNAQAGGAPGPTASAALDAVQKAATATANNAFSEVTPTGPQDASARSDQHTAEPPRASPTVANPWVWLALAIVTGIIALYLQRRLATAA